MERDVILGEGGRFACTAATPWIGAVLRKTYPRAIHPDAVCVGGCSDGCCDDYQCPHCDVRWREGEGQ